jgi:glyoxylase-like metal-dependent hydrolase (beta-lactamase superfamily II)
VPVGRVLTSPWCRVRDTAELAFGGGDVVADRIWEVGFLPVGSDLRNRYRDRLRGLLADVPGGGNTVLVGHGPQLIDAAGVALAEGEAALFQPGGGGFTLVRRVLSNQWLQLGP